MLNRVNTYLKRSSLWRTLIGMQSTVLSSRGLCSLTIGTNEATLLYTPHAKGKIELALCKTFTFAKNVDFANSLAAIVKKHNLEGVACTWMLDSSNYQLILIEDLPVEPSEFQSAIRWKIKGVIPFPIEDAVIDSFQLPIQKTFRPQKMIMVIVSRGSYLQPIVDQIEFSGLKMSSIDIPELALRNIEGVLETKENSSALIYVQSKHADLIITHKNTLYLCRRIDFDIDAAITESEHQVEKLALEIQRSFDFYQSQWRITAPSSVIFASVKPTMANVAETLSTYLATTVTMLNLSEVIVNTVNLSVEQQNKLLLGIGALFREEVGEHETAD